MKNSLFISMLFALVVLMSCDRLRGVRVSRETTDITFNLSTSEDDPAKQTKTTTVTRYIVEVYKASHVYTVVERVEQTSPTIVVSLESNTNYICLFWADGVELNDNASGTYNATNLKNVILNPGKQISEAFFARLDITDATANYNVELKRAVAKINIVATDVVTANTDLQITYDQHRSFNTFTSEVFGPAGSASITFNSAKTTGTLGTILTFSSVVGIVSNFNAVYNTTISNYIPSVPLKANYITNIRGEYASGYQSFALVVLVDDNWENEINGIEINVGTTANPNWIKVADRNAEKGGTNGATAGNSATDYGYYYQWSNADNDPANPNKAHKACFDFGVGGGTWRLPTKDEWIAISGNYGNDNSSNANRKIKWDGTSWKLYDERAGRTTQFVYFPTAGYVYHSSGSTGTDNVGNVGVYWSGTPNGSSAWELLLINTNAGTSVSSIGHLYGLSVRCVKNV